MLGGSFGTTLLGIEDDDFLDLIQFGSQARHRDVDPCSCDPAVCQGPQQHRYSTRETVDVALLIGPMIQWPPAADVAILHCLQDVLNMELTPVRSNTLIIIPFVSVCDENVFAQRGIRELLDDVMSKGIFSLRDLMVISVDRRGNKTFPVRPAQHRLTLLVDGGDRRACAPLDQTVGSILQFLA